MMAAMSRLRRAVLTTPAASRERTLRLTEGLVASTHLVSSSEYLLNERDRKAGGLNDYRITSAVTRLKSPTLRRVAEFASRPEVTRILHGARVVAAGVLLLPTGRRSRSVANAFLLSSQLLLHPRHFYGSDGADQASFLVQVGTSVARISGHPKTVDVSLWYVASQSILSYAVSGWVKLLGPSWRRGDALPGIVRTLTYGDPKVFRLVTQHPRTARALSAGVLAMECLFPVVLAGRGRRLGPLFVGSAAAFHVANARVMGLNRFLTSFVAMHPSVLYVTGPRDRLGPDGPEHRDDRMRGALLAVGAAFMTAGLTDHVRRQRRVRRGRAGEQALTVSSGSTLRFRRTGPDAPPDGAAPDQPLVVLVHGLAATAEYWEWVTQQLSQRFDVLAYNRAGYGSSTYRGGRDFDLDVAVDDLIELVDAQAGTRPVVLMGHSLGGYLAWRAAERLDDRVLAVVMLDASHPLALEHSAAQAAGATALGEGVNRLALVTRLGMGGLLNAPPTIGALPETVRAAVLEQVRDSGLWTASAREWTATERMFAARADLRPLAVPALVLTAESTAEDTPEHALLHARMATGARGSEHHVVADANHDSLLSSRGPARRVAATVARFLDDLTTGAAHEEDLHAVQH